jgi:hypothetical protein
MTYRNPYPSIYRWAYTTEEKKTSSLLRNKIVYPSKQKATGENWKNLKCIIRKGASNSRTAC